MVGVTDGVHPEFGGDWTRTKLAIVEKYGCRGSFNDWRGVLFVDPFGAQLDWSTVEHVASLERLDRWLLFPVSAIGRMLPVRNPDGIPRGWRTRLTQVFGDERWRTLYTKHPQLTFLGEKGPQVRERGVGALLDLYRSKLAEVFEDRLLNDSRTLRNSTNSPLFELIFCVGSSSPPAIRAAKRIARHLIQTI